MYKVNINSAYRTHKRFVFPEFNKEVCINFGRKTVPEGMLVVNPPDVVKNARNKLEMKKILVKAGVSTPPFYTDMPKKFPVLLKKNFRCRGRGTKLIENKEQMPPDVVGNWYYERFLRCHKEYRIHVVMGVGIHADVKVLKEGFDRNWLKNHSNGYRNVKANVDKLPDAVIDEAVKAVTCLGLDFGAVDVGYNTKFKKVRVWEVNTAPGLRTVTTNFYQKSLTLLILNKFKLEAKYGEEVTGN